MNLTGEVAEGRTNGVLSENEARLSVGFDPPEFNDFLPKQSPIILVIFILCAIDAIAIDVTVSAAGGAGGVEISVNATEE